MLFPAAGGKRRRGKSMTTRVKICGITSLEDALAALEAGADALGFMFYEPSPRFITAERAGEITRQLPVGAARVGVFVDAGEEEINRVIVESGVDTLQFHGAETPEFCGRFNLKTIKVFRVRNLASLEPLSDFVTDAWLLDSYVKGVPGGTGEAFNWDLSLEAKRHGHPLVLAGGLTPANVQQAVREVRPFAVDVSSGVEAAPGEKDPEKVCQFIAAAKGGNRPTGFWK